MTLADMVGYVWARGRLGGSGIGRTRDSPRARTMQGPLRFGRSNWAVTGSLSLSPYPSHERRENNMLLWDGGESILHYVTWGRTSSFGHDVGGSHRAPPRQSTAEVIPSSSLVHGTGILQPDRPSKGGWLPVIHVLYTARPPVAPWHAHTTDGALVYIDLAPSRCNAARLGNGSSTARRRRNTGCSRSNRGPLGVTHLTPKHRLPPPNPPQSL